MASAALDAARAAVAESRLDACDGTPAFLALLAKFNEAGVHFTGGDMSSSMID